MAIDGPPDSSHALSWPSEQSTASRTPPSVVDSPDSCSHAEAPSHRDKVVLEVGERFFTTTRRALRESPVLTALVSNAANRQADNSYFVDADPHPFVYVLSFLRRGLFPLFFTLASGHDHVMYRRVGAEAAHFQIDRLSAWLRRRGYEDAVRVVTTRTVLEGAAALSREVRGHERVRHDVAWQKRRTYLCPRRVVCHQGRPERCGRECHNHSRAGVQEFLEEDIPMVLETREEVQIDNDQGNSLVELFNLGVRGDP